MNKTEIGGIVQSILYHPAPVVFGNVSEDVKKYLEQLYSEGDAVVAPISSSVTACAKGYSGGEYWWKGAGQLCELLARLGSPAAKTALLTILKTDSKIVEFDEVRATAAIQLSKFNDPQLVQELTECSKLPNAPVAAIKKAIEALGGTLGSPEAVIAAGRELEPVKGVEYFSGFEGEVTNWPEEKRAAFYYFAGRKAESAYGKNAAYPLYAAALLASPGSDSAAWLSFPETKPSPENARSLSEEYPLRGGYLSSLKYPPQSPKPVVQPAPAKKRPRVNAAIVIGTLVFLGGCFMGAVMIFGQLLTINASPASSNSENMVGFLEAMGCFSIFPLLVGSGLIGLGIYNLRKKGRNQPVAEPPKNKIQQAPVQPAGITGTSITLWAKDEATARQLGTDRYFLVGALMGDSSSAVKDFLNALNQGGALSNRITPSPKGGFNVEITVSR